MMLTPVRRNMRTFVLCHLPVVLLTSTLSACWRQHALSVDVNNTTGKWQSTKVRMFLRTGVNIIDVMSTAKLSLDYIEAVAVDNAPIYSIEAEDATVVGTPAAGDPGLIRDDVFAKYASGGKYVNG